MTETQREIETQQVGYLELIIGPMFSGKTTELLKIFKQCQFCDISVSIINHSSDTRYHDMMLSSHDKIMAPCFQSTTLKDIWLNYEDRNVDANMLMSSDVILINEGQFFVDLYEVVVDMLDKNKKIYICGLDGDFNRNKFGALLDLIPLCDKVHKLTAMCSLCKNGTPGIFSLRLSKETDQTIIGSENYIPVCRKCYNNCR